MDNIQRTKDAIANPSNATRLARHYGKVGEYPWVYSTLSEYMKARKIDKTTLTKCVLLYFGCSDDQIDQWMNHKGLRVTKITKMPDPSSYSGFDSRGDEIYMQFDIGTEQHRIIWPEKGEPRLNNDAVDPWKPMKTPQDELVILLIMNQKQAKNDYAAMPRDIFPYLYTCYYGVDPASQQALNACFYETVEKHELITLIE